MPGYNKVRVALHGTCDGPAGACSTAVQQGGIISMLARSTAPLLYRTAHRPLLAVPSGCKRCLLVRWLAGDGLQAFPLPGLLGGTSVAG